MAKQLNEIEFRERVEKMIPKSIRDLGFTAIDVISDVECDEIDGGDGYEPSYWVYLNDGFISEYGNGSHTIHEDTLKEVKLQMSMIIYDEADAKNEEQDDICQDTSILYGCPEDADAFGGGKY